MPIVDKYVELRLATCKIIEQDQITNFNNTEEAINRGLCVPIFSDYYMLLAQIDYKRETTIRIINDALKIAIEEFLHYYPYRPSPRGLETIA